MQMTNEQAREKLVQWRRQAGLSQRGLASLLDTTQGSISRYERGESVPDMEMLSRWASACGITLLVSEQARTGDTADVLAQAVAALPSAQREQLATIMRALPHLPEPVVEGWLVYCSTVAESASNSKRA